MTDPARRALRPVGSHRAEQPGRPAGPFAVLGLDPDAELTDDEVRAAWRRVAAANHPDRADGGDPERFAVAAAAYTELRTTSGRGEARADQAASAVTGRTGTGRPPRWKIIVAAGPAGRLATRIWLGRPIRLVLRILAATTAGAAGVLAAWPGPAAPALATGALTWLVLTAGRDLRAR